MHNVKEHNGKWDFHVQVDEWRYNHYNLNRQQIDQIPYWFGGRKQFKKGHDTSMLRYKDLINEKCGNKCSDKLFKLKNYST